jgi:hypothetical protein
MRTGEPPVEEGLTELDVIWLRCRQGEPITEDDFLTAARWAYHTSPPENIGAALLTLFESGSRRPLAH